MGLGNKAFLKEAKFLKRLNHPCVVSVNSIFIDEHYGYIEMPFYENGNLRSWIETKKPSEFQLQSIFLHVIRGLEYLHQCGVIHCDIKPENIFIDAKNHPKIGDFDISKDVSARITTLITETSKSLSGTLNYMAPGLLI